MNLSMQYRSYISMFDPANNDSLFDFTLIDTCACGTGIDSGHGHTEDCKENFRAKTTYNRLLLYVDRRFANFFSRFSASARISTL